MLATTFIFKNKQFILALTAADSIRSRSRHSPHKLIGSIALLICMIFLYNDAIAQKATGSSNHPKVVTPGRHGAPPSDAIILFDKGSLAAFESVTSGEPPLWNVRGSKFTVEPETGNIQTKDKFGDCQLHIEWKTSPKDVKAGKTGQGCSNSGIYLMGKYEVQVLNSYINETDPDRQAGAIYKQHIPLVNASMKPGKWQVYDIIFKAPRFDEKGTQTASGKITILHNGVLIQNNVEIQGPTRAHNENLDISNSELPLMLQDHNNKVIYRNIWIRKL